MDTKKVSCYVKFVPNQLVYNENKPNIQIMYKTDCKETEIDIYAMYKFDKSGQEMLTASHAVNHWPYESVRILNDLVYDMNYGYLCRAIANATKLQDKMELLDMYREIYEQYKDTLYI